MNLKKILLSLAPMALIVITGCVGESSNPRVSASVVSGSDTDTCNLNDPAQSNCKIRLDYNTGANTHPVLNTNYGLPFQIEDSSLSGIVADSDFSSNRKFGEFESSFNACQIQINSTPQNTDNHCDISIKYTHNESSGDANSDLIFNLNGINANPIHIKVK